MIVRKRLAAFIATAATATTVLADASAAMASPPPGGGGSAGTCAPTAQASISGNTITYYGGASCPSSRAPFGYELQLGYIGADGSSKYTSVKTCVTPLCGINGVVVHITDARTGSQRWCVSTHIMVAGDAGHRKDEWSVASCLNH